MFKKGLTLSLAALSMAAGAATKKPNVVFIMCDDMRYDEMSSAGHPYIKTPNLDKLKKSAVNFSNCYVTAPLCGPVRSSVFSGRHVPSHGRLYNEYYPKSLTPYIPRNFHNAGYRTALMGKFYEEVDKGIYAKDKTVYDRWFQMSGPYIPPGKKKMTKAELNQWRQKYYYYDQMYNIDGNFERRMGHMTDVLFNEAVRFIGETQKMDKPFFVNLSVFAPHGPWNPSRRRLNKYKGKGVSDYGSVNFKTEYSKNYKKKMDWIHERECEMVEDIDENVGMLIDYLREQKLLENTIFIFTSDNGMMHGEHGFLWKRHPWQESIRVPLIIRYPELTKAGGTTCKGLVSLADILVTAADICKVTLPKDDKRYGKSIVPLLDSSKAQVHKQLLTMQYGPVAPKRYDTATLVWAGVINPDGYSYFKYAEPPMPRPEFGRSFLFDWNKDKLEMNNLAKDKKYNAKTAAMQKELVELLKEQGASAEDIKAIQQ